MIPEEAVRPLTKLEENAPAEPPTMAQKWRAASLRWAKDVKIAYLSNPAARRDFNVQFRGNRSWPMLGSIVVLMAGVCLYLYWTISTEGLGPEGLQEKLLLFCTIIFGLLGMAVSLISPASGAASILSEKQSRSLDLVFSSPIKPASYLLGKLTASYRLLWVFMALSLPFTALSILMGGATWWNILEAYFLLSLQGLLFSAIGLYFASLVEKTISALLYTYVTVIAYLAAMTILGYPFMTGQPGSVFPGGPMNPLASLVPFFVEFASGTYTPIFGLPVPNFLIAAGISLGAVKLLLTCASGFLSPLRDRERAGLRVQVAAVVATISGITGYQIGSLPHPIEPALHAMAALITTVPLLIFLPFLSCYGSDAERRQVHNKLFAVRDALGKSVAGALPYIYLLLGVSGLAYTVGRYLTHSTLDGDYLVGLLYAFGFWTFAWATTRLASSFNHGIKASRTLQFLTLGGFIGLPAPIFVALSSGFVDSGFTHEIWKWFPVAPFIGQFESGPAMIYALGLFILGIGFATISEKNYRKQVNRKKLQKMAAELVLSSTSNLNIAQTESAAQRLVQNA